MQRHHLTKLFFAGAAALWLAISAPVFGQGTTPADDETVTLEKFEVKEMRTFSDYAVVGITPITVTEVKKEKIVDLLSSRDVPFALEQAPSFFVTNSGGGAGDSRLTVRGFNERNVSIVINGVPTNDNENGWLYWSNWDGLGDATQAVQLQRGLSYSTLPTPSIGGTLTVTTDPAEATMGVSAKIEVGDDGFKKQSITANTGVLANRFAMTVSVTNKQGSGYTKGTWTAGQGYYIGLSYKLNAKNRVEFYGIAAPQMHGQNSYQQSIATYDQGYARSLGFTDAQLALFPYQGRRYNQRFNYIDPNYTGQVFYYGGLHSRHNPNYLNEVVNYYNKPQVNLNWFSTLSEHLKLGTVVYFSGGEGAGNANLGATYRKVSGAGTANPAPVDWYKTIAANVASTTGSKGVMANNTNYQKTYGAVVKISYDPDNAWKFSAGLDGRMATIDHWYEIRDLLGGSYFIPTVTQWSRFYNSGASIAATQPRLGLGDKANYYYSNKVKWLGGFAQTQYNKGPITAFAVYGYSIAAYKYTNLLVLNDDGSPRSLTAKNFTGNQIKGGLQYKLSDNVAVFGNAGWVSKVPIHSAVFTYSGLGRYIASAPNERFNSFETGVRANFFDKKLTLSSSFYYTTWRNRTVTATTDNFRFTDGTTGTAVTYQTGINSNYGGLEIEADYRPLRWVTFELNAAFNNWYFTGDGHKDIVNQNNGGVIDSSGSISLKGVKIGEAPQSQVNLGVTVFPVKGLSITANVRNAQRYYAYYAPETRTNDWGQSWKLPNFTVCDLHVNYRLNLTRRLETKLFVHVLNVFNRVYVQDATDNWFTVAGANAHSAQRAEVWLGTPLTMNMGVKISF